MAHPFEKNYFKKYLHKNCHRSWFSRQANNAQYKDRNGTHDVDAYADEYTVRVREILEDPYLDGDNMMARGTEIAGHSVAAFGGITAAMFAAGPLGPLFGGITLLTVGLSSATEVGTQVISNNFKNIPKDVYFHITGDDSYWKAEQVPCGGIRDIAYKVCRWSNEVYRERYIQKRSDNYEFQAQIEQRSPTPY